MLDGPLDTVRMSPARSLKIFVSFTRKPMKKLIRRLSRVADSSQYTPLRSEPRSPSRACRTESFRAGNFRRSRARSGTVPEGYIPVYVGEEMERFVVSAALVNHPIFVKLLNKSAQEYGYEQKGVLRIPCHVLVFERVLEALRVGDESVQDLLNSSDDFL
ncbi:Auxin-responsive protein saur72 [Sarracenia purpurea var. burkii]